MLNKFITQLPDRFFLELAIGVQSFETICAIYNLDPETINQYEDDPTFQRGLAIAEQSVEDDGRAFRARCRTVVHDSIQRIQTLIKDPEVPPATQLNAFQTLVKYSGMEPKPQAQQGAAGTTLTLTIIGPNSQRLEAGRPGVVIDQEPEDVEQEPLALASPEESSLYVI